MLFALAATISAGTASAARIFGVAVQGANQTLVTWNSANPSTLLSSVPITGLPANETIRGIDFNPAYSQGTSVYSPSGLA